MRTIIVVVLTLLGMVLTVTSADAGAWCANYRRRPLTSRFEGLLDCDGLK